MLLAGNRRGVGVGTGADDIVWQEPDGWVWRAGGKWWPAMFGQPPEISGATWEPIYR